jgi:hypothetical protein
VYVRHVPPSVGCNDARDRTDQQVQAASCDGEGTTGEVAPPLPLPGSHRDSRAWAVSITQTLNLGYAPDSTGNASHLPVYGLSSNQYIRQGELSTEPEYKES